MEQRRQAKAAELKALGPDEAALLGLGRVSERTLKRMSAAIREDGLAGCIDRRWVRACTGHRSISEEVREAIFAARAEFLHRSKMSMRDCHVLAVQYVAEKFGPQLPVPSYWTVRAAWLEWFGPGGTRHRYVRTAEAVDSSQVHIVVAADAGGLGPRLLFEDDPVARVRWEATTRKIYFDELPRLTRAHREFAAAVTARRRSPLPTLHTRSFSCQLSPATARSRSCMVLCA